MARYTKQDAFTVPQINNELEKIEQAIQDTLSRKGDAPNTMTAPLDMNGERVLNLPEPVADTEPLRRVDATQYVTAAASSAAAALASEQAAAASAEEAGISESLANTAAELSEDLYDELNTLYLGSYTSGPATDNQGDPLVQGVLYYNTVQRVLFVFNGSIWVEAASQEAANSAAISADEAEDSADAALASQQAAASSETSAESSASSATTSALSASSSAQAANSSAQAASTSATNAGLSAASANASANTAQSAATSATDSATDATTSETNAASSATAAASSATNASSSATAAAGSATDSANSASASDTSASNAATSATNAAASATAAATSATAAETAETNALASYNSFIEKYYGAYASEPTVDPLGNSMDEGDLYFNTGDNTLYIFNGTNWQRASTTIEGIYDLTEYTNVAGQTTFNVAYDVGLVQVLYNGVQLSEGDFTATDNATVVLDTAVADAADIITIIRWGAVTESSVIVEAPTGGTAIKRTATGAARVANGVNADEAVTKAQLDTKVDDSQLNTAATADSVAQRTSDGSINAVNVYASGNLGVGLTNPAVQLHVAGAGSQIFLENTDATANGSHAYSVTAIKPGVGFLNYNHGGWQHIFKVGGSQTDAMQIDSSGNVGIGTSSPATKGHFYSTVSMDQLSVDGVGSIETGINFKSGGTTYGQIYFNNVSPYDMSVLQQYSTGSLIFGTNDTERMRIDSSGNVGIGTTSISSRLDLNRASSGAIITLRQGGTTMGQISTLNTDLSILGSTGRGLYFAIESILPASVGAINDNDYDLGAGAYRFRTLYAATGTINTSDAREKTPVDELTTDELNAAKQLSKEIGTYQFLSAVAKKGDAARKHVGMTVQRAIEIMEANNLDPFAYGFICYDEWEEQTVDHPAVEAVEGKEAWTETVEHEAELDENGEVIKEAWVEVIEHEAIEAVEAKDAYTEVVQEAGNRYSFRPDEMLLFIARGLEARIQALEEL